jgi:hypothetical protein
VSITEVWIGNCIYWILTLVTTKNHDSLTELHTPKITVTIAQMKSSSPRYIAPARTAYKTSLPSLHVLSLPGNNVPT